MLLEYDLIVGVFYAKMSNSRSFWAPFIYCNLGPLYFRLKPKMQKPALDCCWICWKVSNLIAQKLTKNIGSLEMGPLGLGHQYDFCCVLTVKVWPRFNLPIKSYSICAHRQTHNFHSYRWGQDFLRMEIYAFSLHYVHLFALFTHSLRL